MKTWKAKFKYGKAVISAGVDALRKENIAFSRFVMISLGKYISGNWGVMDEEDKKLNEEAVVAGEGRLMGAYIFHKSMPDERKIWIITESDRSVTTVLFPEEY